SSWKARLDPVALVSIGPQTSEVCRNLLGRLDGEASPHDLAGLVEACALALRGSD
ncbi:MAG: uroporphyrinogen-III synthase, partial [Prochlorococcaceae cyanobacterium]